MHPQVDSNAQVTLVSGDPSSDDTWTVEVDGCRVRLRVEGGRITDWSFESSFTGDPDNGTTIFLTAEAAVLDAIEYHNTCKGFGNHPDVVM